MKYLTILFFISSIVLSATPEHKTLVSQLVKHYNSSEYKQIFTLYSDEMKKALPLTKNDDYFIALKFQEGDVKTIELYEKLGVSTSNYKATFENSVLSIILTSNEDKNITGFRIVPFVERKTLVNKIADSQTFLSKEQLNIIFEHSHLFPNNTQISFAFIKADRVKYFGIVLAGDEIKAIDNHDKVFEIGSITKVFTSTILANFINRKKINLNDTIDSYLDINLKDNVQISFKELASHYSGLPRMPSNFTTHITDNNNPFKDYGIMQLKEYLENELSLNEKSFNYSNLGVGLLGYTLSKVSNKSYQQLLDEVIFKPLKMLNSTTKRKTIEPLLIKGLNSFGDSTPNWNLNVLSTVEDLAKFANAQFDQSKNDFALTRQETNVANNKSIGLGWFISKKSNGNHIYEHNGGTGGYRSAMILIPNLQEGIILLSNVSAFNLNSRHIDKLAYDLMKTL